MADEVKVTERVRAVIDEQVVVLRPGQLIPAELARQLGILPPAARRPKPVAAKAGRHKRTTGGETK